MFELFEKKRKKTQLYHRIRREIIAFRRRKRPGRATQSPEIYDGRKQVNIESEGERKKNR